MNKTQKKRPSRSISTGAGLSASARLANFKKKKASTSRTISNRPGGAKRGGKRGNKRSGGGRSSGGFRGGSRRRGGGRDKKKKQAFNPSQFINKNPVELVEEVYEPKNTFHTFGLDSRLVQRLDAMKITIPSPIQDQTIAEVMSGRDVVGLAETGTGKTAAFLLPLIQRTLEDNHHQTLILAPTRELAIQINEELRELAKNLPREHRMFSVVCVGGMNIRPQLLALKRRQHFVIGTPGRVLDLIERGAIKPSEMSAVVLDEADRMLDMGFIHDMRKILSQTPPDRQTLFFSATMNNDAKNIIKDFLNDPVMVSVKKKDVVDTIEQDVVMYHHNDKFATLLNLFADPSFKRVIIFGSMKHSVEKLSRELIKSGVKAISIHGNKNHAQRQRALRAFKSGQVRVLVATDVAARGIHVDNVSHVINYDLPQAFEDYVHRIGRTGRSHHKGMALTFVQKK